MIFMLFISWNFQERMLLTDCDFTKIVPEDNALLRSGVIPYVKRDGKVYFLLGVDAKTGEWSDFGGGVKANENALFGGIRECYEEMRGIVDFREMGLIRHAIYERKSKQNMCIMFSEITRPGFFENARKEFHNNQKNGDEMKDIVWLSADEMLYQSCLSNRKSKIWRRIRYVLSKSGQFNRNFVRRL